MSSVGTFGDIDLRQGTHESNVLFNRAVELLNRNRIGPARKQLEMALQICPHNPSYLSFYGLCVAIESADYDAARRLCERAVRMTPSDPLNRVNLGRVLRMQGDNGAAYTEFLNAWKLDKQHPAPAAELSRMGIRRPPVFPFLDRSHWINVRLGRLRAQVHRLRAGL
jgi:predicted Zn-dependent protease